MKKKSLLLVMALVGFAASAQDAERLTDAHRSNFRSWSVGLHLVNSFTYGDLVSFQSDKPAGVDGAGIALGGDLAITKWWGPSVGTRVTGGYYTISGSGQNYDRNFGVDNIPIYFEGNMINGSFNLMFNLSNMFMRGRIRDRKGALLFGVGAGFSNSKSELFAGGTDTTAIIDPSTGNPVIYNPGDKISETGATDAFGRAQIPAERPSQFYMPLTLEYKYRLNNLLDIDLGARYLFTSQDWIDVYQSKSNNDKFLQTYLGLTLNLGEKEKKSIVYSNPLDGMFADVQEVKENFDQITTDDDKDGVSNFFDKDNSTPAGVMVDGAGRALDVDSDGIPDAMDEDPFTAKGARVDENGRAVDSDGDGVPDYMDEEANTPEGDMVNFMGRTIKNTGGGVSEAFIPSVFFAYNSASVTDANHFRLATIARVMKANKDLSVELVGFADKRGSEEFNKNLAMRRAEAVKKQLSQVYGIDEGRMSTRSEGETEPLADGRYDINRRVDVLLK